MVAGPEVSRLATEYEIVSEAKDANEKVRHHEQTARAQLQFFEKIGKLYTVMKEMGNPFQEEIADFLAIPWKHQCSLIISIQYNGQLNFILNPENRI